MQRRELLKMITAATGMAMIGLPSVVFGQAQLPVPPANNAFSKTQVALLDEIADTILPRTDTPGAKDAGVGLFMARFVTDCYDPQQQAVFRAGLADLDKRAKGGFLALKPAQRTAWLRADLPAGPQRQGELPQHLGAGAVAGSTRQRRHCTHP